MKLLNYKISVFLLSIASVSFAQRPDNNLPTESVDIISDFDARLLESSKVNVAPTLPQLDTTTQRQTYVVPPHPAAVGYDAPSLRPLGMKSVKQEPPNDGYVKLGAGIPTSLYGEAGYYYGTDRFDLRAWGRHHSLSANQAIENQKFFNNDLSVGGNVYLESGVAIGGNVGYSFDRYHFYGYDHEVFEYDAERVRQDFKILDLGARVFNSERNEIDFNYAASPSFYLLNDYYSNRENGFALPLTLTKWFGDRHPLRLTIRPDLTTFEDTAEQKLNNIYLQPSFTFHTDIFKVRIGGNFVNNRDVVSAFPDAELTLSIFGDGIQIFAGATGDLRKNTYRTLSDYNPFIEIRGTRLRNTRWDNYYGGLKGNLGFLEYTGQAGFSKASGLALFLPFQTSEGITRFRTLYDTARIVNIQGTAKIIPFRALTIMGTVSYNTIFEMENEDSHWGLPKVEGNFQAVYALLDGRAQLRSALYIADGIPRINEFERPGKSGALLDLNVGGNYYFTDNIGVFLDINNLLNNKRERWYNYPTVGMNFLAGVTARF
jgi:hypothetical protein